MSFKYQSSTEESSDDRQRLEDFINTDERKNNRRTLEEMNKRNDMRSNRIEDHLETDSDIMPDNKSSAPTRDKTAESNDKNQSLGNSRNTSKAEPVSILVENTTEPESNLVESAAESNCEFVEAAIKPRSNLVESALETDSDLVESAVEPQSDLVKSSIKPQSKFVESAIKPESSLVETAIEPQSDLAERTEDSVIQRGLVMKSVYKSDSDEKLKEFASVLANDSVKESEQDNTSGDITIKSPSLFVNELNYADKPGEKEETTLRVKLAGELNSSQSSSSDTTSNPDTGYGCDNVSSLSQASGVSCGIRDTTGSDDIHPHNDKDTGRDEKGNYDNFSLQVSQVCDTSLGNPYLSI
jgi:hypothetical protein